MACGVVVSASVEKWAVSSIEKIQSKIDFGFDLIFYLKKIGFSGSHTGAKTHFLSRNSIDLIFQKCEFCEKCDFKNVNFEKNMISKM